MQDSVIPLSKWVFDSEVTAAFDDMLERSIPQYEVMRQTCFDLGKHFVKSGKDCVDLGASRGEALWPFIKRFGAQARFHAVEISDPMIAALTARYSGYIDAGIVCIHKTDLRNGFPQVEASLILSILTLQFIPIEYRPTLLQRVFNSLNSGGALIIVEKILSANGKADELFTSEYLALKAHNGYSAEQIERKRLSLEGVLVPVTAKANIEFLKDAGFSVVECFWRWLNFAGFIAIKH